MTTVMAGPGGAGGQGHVSQAVNSAGWMQTADKRPRLFERSEFLGRPPCILPALDRLACGIGRLSHPGRV